MSKTKDTSWIEEAWEYSRMAENEDITTTIEQYHEYVTNRENKRVDSEGQPGHKGQIQRSDL